MNWKNIYTYASPIIAAVLLFFIAKRRTKKFAYSFKKWLGLALITFGLLIYITDLLFPTLLSVTTHIRLSDYAHPQYDRGVFLDNVVGTIYVGIGIILLALDMKAAKGVKHDNKQ